MQTEEPRGGTPNRLPRYFVWVIVLFIGLLTGLRFYFEQVPRGAQFIPFYLFSDQGPSIPLPNGKTLQVYFNDAGAAHSGNHWTWVVASDRITGRRVVAQGYVSPFVRIGQRSLPTSRDNDVLTVKFLRGRRSDESGPIATIDLKNP